jgi:glycosyltransferase involved in cell wall biosynthesis
MISILIPIYNSEKFLNQSISSVLNQTYKNFELLLVNDGSNDSSLKIIRNFSLEDSRIRVINFKKNCGMASALNKGISKAKFDLVIRMDADDIMLPNRVQKQLDFMIANSNVSVASCLANYINSQGKILGKTYSDLKTIDISQDYYRKNKVLGLLHPGVIFRKKHIQCVGGYRGKFWPAEDIDLWNRLLEKGYNIVVMQEVLMFYRIHEHSIITSEYMLSRLKYEWLTECMIQRRLNNKEPTWEEFISTQDNYSFFKKINIKRKRFAKLFYREAGFFYGENKKKFFLFKLFLSLLLQPIYVLKKIKDQVIK